MNELISIIVPVYNVEPYLKNCIQSIRNQTYPMLEILLVDDGSTDQSGRICDEYKKMDERIKVIHKKNGGLSDARNAGLAIASGEYIGFVDSDDAIHPEMYERLYLAVKNKGADIALCDFKRVRENGAFLKKKVAAKGNRSVTVLKREQAQELYFDKDKRIALTVAWNKLYKRDLFEGIQFPKGKIHEDEFTTYQLLYRAKDIVHIKEELYYYLIRESSITGQFNMKRFDLLEAYRCRMIFYQKKRELNLWKKMAFLYMRMFAQYVDWIKKTNHYNVKQVEFHRKMFCSLYYRNQKHISFLPKEKAECLLFCNCTSLYLFLWSFMKKR